MLRCALRALQGIGAGVDSFYEYLLKSYVVFGRTEYLHMFEEVGSLMSACILL